MCSKEIGSKMKVHWYPDTFVVLLRILQNKEPIGDDDSIPDDVSSKLDSLNADDLKVSA